MTDQREMPRGRLRVLIATFAGSMDTNALIPIIYLYATLLGADLIMAGAIVGMYSIVHAPANLLFGKLVDRVGRRWPLVAGLLWDGFSMILYALAQNPIHLLMARVSHGVGGGLVGPSSMSFLADTSTSDRRGRAMALYGISIAFAVIVGFSISGALVAAAGGAREGYESVFYLLFGILIFGALLASTVPEAPRPKRDAEPKAEPVNRRLLLAGYVSIFSLYFILGTFTILVPKHIKASGFGESEVAMAFVVFALFSVFVHYPGGRLTDARGPRIPVTAGLVLTGVAIVVLAPLTALGPLLAVMIVFGVGHGLVFPSSSAMVASASRSGRMGLSTGGFYTVLVAGVAIGAPLMALVADTLGIGPALQLSAVASAVGIALVLLLLRLAGSGPGAA